ncbi:MAG: DUF167 domain-containing protein [Candidatus Nanopelagicales bacterium]
MRFEIRVRPGASRAGVGGAINGRLQVRVNARAVDGRATEAALRALADAFGLRPADVQLLSGATSRDKLVQIAGETQHLQDRLDELLTM